MDREPEDLQFEVQELLEEETESKRSLDFNEFAPLRSAHRQITVPSGSLQHLSEPVDNYDGRHRYDPDFQWAQGEEKKVIRKIDWRIGALICLMFVVYQVDRSNISEAPSTSTLEDLGLSSSEYGTGRTIYSVCFMLACLPSQLLAKCTGPSTWMSLQVICWSIIACLQSGCSGRWSFWIVRGCLGLLQGGFLPASVLYLSYFYTSKELPLRLAWFWSSYQVTNIFSALLTYGLLHVSSLYNIPGWRWLFAFEGTSGCLIGCLSWLYLPATPTQSTPEFHGKGGWFSVRQEMVAVNRVLRDDPSKGDSPTRAALAFGAVWQGLSDHYMWPIYLLGFSCQVPSIPSQHYLVETLHTLGFTTLEVNLLTVPASATWIMNLLVLTYASERMNQRFILSTYSQIWVLPLLTALETLPKNRNTWQTYPVVMMLFAQPYVHAILISSISRNSGCSRARTVSLALYVMCMQASDIIGSNVYRRGDAPFYYHGNIMLMIIAVYNLLLLLGTKRYYTWSNQQRDLLWEGVPQEERQAYSAETKDQGNKRLDFRFAH